MRRFRLPRVLSSSLMVLIFLVLVLHSVLRVKFHFGVETKFYRHPPKDGYSYASSYHPDRPWYMRGGVIRPTETRVSGLTPALWPHEDPTDRIVNQLMYIPAGYGAFRNESKNHMKRILLYHGRRGWSDLPLGRSVFIRDKCPVDTCEITTGIKKAESSDLVLFKDRFISANFKRSPKQVWLLFLLECPLHTQSFLEMAGLFNWTASYRHDSDIVAPYEKFVPYPDYNGDVSSSGAMRNYAAGKSGKVAWFVSNCAARNKRLQYAKELSQYIEVDLYGKCGTLKCPRTSSGACFQLLNKQYKFYLAFENSNCKDYITEKFFLNGLGHDVIPIVMGARPYDYERVAPPHSYIHVEDFSGPAELAEYLHLLDKNDTLYNSYFLWKNTGEFINTRFWCRLCALLHAPVVPKVYTDIHTWWAGKGTCTNDEWRKKPVTTTTTTAVEKSENS